MLENVEIKSTCMPEKYVSYLSQIIDSSYDEYIKIGASLIRRRKNEIRKNWNIDMNSVYVFIF